MNWEFQLAQFPVLSFSLDDVKSQIPRVPRMLTPWAESTPSTILWTEFRQRKHIKRFLKNYYWDETWAHHHDPETKQESMQWKHKGSPTPKEFRVQQSAGKVSGIQKVFCFWNSCHTRQPLLETPTLIQWWLYVRISNRNATPWKVVGWCPAASWQCTCTQVTHIAGYYKEMWLRRA